jgi:hypothetical protein
MVFVLMGKTTGKKFEKILANTTLVRALIF